MSKLFRYPNGLAGNFAGRIMARSNLDMAISAVSALSPLPDSHVAEIGYGPGVGLSILAGYLPQGQVLGIDPSVTMQQMARRRCRRQSNVTPLVGSAEDLPWADNSLDGLISLNCVQFWEDKAFTELVRVLKPEARAVIGVHDWSLKHGTEKLQRRLREVGLSVKSARLWGAKSGDAIELLATLPSE